MLDRLPGVSLLCLHAAVLSRSRQIIRSRRGKEAAPANEGAARWFVRFKMVLALNKVRLYSVYKYERLCGMSLNSWPEIDT